jgi:serine/threonine-protein kinase
MGRGRISVKNLPCPFCRGAHPAEVRVCPVTGRSVERGASGLPKLKPFAMETLDDVDTRVGNPKPASVQPTSRSGPAGMVGDILAMKYKLLSLLGTGGMGAVYEGEHIQLGRPVAIKVLMRGPSTTGGANAEKRFIKEARSAGALAHPNICQVFDFGTTPNGSPYIVMERLVGETLGQRLGRERSLPIADAVAIAIQVTKGLGAAHDQNILHRDVKPENVFLARVPGTEGEVVKLLDFGIAKNMESHGGSLDTLTQHGMVMGTPHYMSPEQARGRRDLDARVDLYATGVMLYEMLAGVRPFEAKMANDILLQIVRNAPTPLRTHRPDVPAELERIVLKAMRKERNDRHGTAEELVAELAAVARAIARGPATTGTTAGVDPRGTRGEAPTVHRPKTEDEPAPPNPYEGELPSRLDLRDLTPPAKAPKPAPSSLDVMRTIEDPNPRFDDEDP